MICDVLQKIVVALKREHLEIMDEFIYPSLNWVNGVQWHDVSRNFGNKGMAGSWYS